MLRYAAIDIGSNAVRLLIADIIKNGKVISFKKNTLIRVPLRLGDDAFLHKYISDRKKEDLAKTMSAFRNLMDVYQVTDYMACATSAMREAKNGDSVIQEVAKTGIKLTIIDGNQEATMIYNSHLEKQFDRKKTVMYIDVGGGSTELSLFSNTELIASRSFDIGTIRILDNQDKDETWAAMKCWVKKYAGKLKTVIGVGTGGNINKIARIANENVEKPLTFAKLKATYEYLNAFTLKDRIHVLGLNDDRADVIIPACEIFITLMKWVNMRTLYIPRIGLADGMVQTLIEKNFPDVT
ncbi:exopolyphosphatase / guanosine-5'-triphosphate,3'-diphosphate pyrophosphatase [bacterium A37T11]|nr:exopolyphosphatase / guanosine-5'-triphosphate,3'-diphosphate pyrophosphatase [bacterium A37T11]